MPKHQRAKRAEQPSARVGGKLVSKDAVSGSHRIEGSSADEVGLQELLGIQRNAPISVRIRGDVFKLRWI